MRHRHNNPSFPLIWKGRPEVCKKNDRERERGWPYPPVSSSSARITEQTENNFSELRGQVGGWRFLNPQSSLQFQPVSLPLQDQEIYDPFHPSMDPVQKNVQSRQFQFSQDQSDKPKWNIPNSTRTMSGVLKSSEVTKNISHTSNALYV